MTAYVTLLNRYCQEKLTWEVVAILVSNSISNILAPGIVLGMGEVQKFSLQLLLPSFLYGRHN
jgi:hypothetical protein